MNTTTRAVATAALMLAVVAPLSAQGRQQGPRAMQGPSVDRGGAPGMLLAAQVQAALRSQQELELDADQVAELESLRSELERMAESARLEREARRSDGRERPESEEERIEQRRALMDEMRAERARTDTIVAEFQARFEAAVPPLQRQQLRRDHLQDRRDRVARSNMRGSRGGALAPRLRQGRDGAGNGLRERGPRGRFPGQGDRWGR